METELILAELARLKWKQRKMSARSLQKQDAMEDTKAESSEYIEGKKEREVINGNSQELNKDSLSKSMDDGTVSYQNDALHLQKGNLDQGVGSNSKPMDFLAVPTHKYPNDTVTRQRRNAIKHDFVGGEDILVKTEADVKESFIEIPTPPLEINSNSAVVFEDNEKAPLEDLVRQLTPQDEENEANLTTEKMQIENHSVQEVELKIESLQEMEMKNNSLRKIEKEKRSNVNFSSESRSPVLKRRNSDISRKKKGRDYKVVQFVEDEPELIHSKKSSIKQGHREKGIMKSDEKHKLLEEIQQLREEKLREEEKRKELEQTLESVKNWETTQRLQKVLDEKKKKQAREAERLRQEMFENNRKRRQVFEKELLLKVSRNRKEREKMIRYQRQKQEQEEMLREGAMSNFVQSMLNMWRPHLSPRSSVKEQESMDGVEVNGHSSSGKTETNEIIDDPLYSRIHKSSSSSTLPSIKSLGKTKQKKKKDHLLQSRKAASFDLSTNFNDEDLYERANELHPDLYISSHANDDLMNSYNLVPPEHHSDNVVTTTISV
ncbi:DNA ligase 1-like [Ostrea edulis]|uniref:DNA ligase 1-like n=1 Tax=Ostrea edulis TaxID=37623 RepID=UPI002094D5EA|nr:DNA ligase 1-like [Ostrea edulis]